MREIFLAPPCVNVEKQAAVKRQTRCMRKPTTACQRLNLKVAGPVVCKNIAEFNEIENSSLYSGEDGANHEAMRKGKPLQALRQGDESLCNLLDSPLHWVGERKTP